ncbi:bifunctional serine/threonine-protein kinase/ABC transporter substrate-binding protein [Streptomyces sp. SBT349]|uniref:bifunctional serine/threonine-protein kinase/ABC transporter substrate-binding protein n=1 Tax=Streptomyces sp. SBT349 TaxID=1580539 RepID=UPI00066D5976|nr:bifunctional serine/threonine-protein kinase/ABC transporter substrate-binding protein [Streptomyces sp. SBT349]
MRPLSPSDPSQIAGHRLLALLGSGGMGAVYLGADPEGGLVAVKVIRPERADDPGFRGRFRREVAAARRVSSRWTVPVLDADTEAAAPWLITAFVPGPSLAEALAAHGPLPERSLRGLGAVLAEALAAAHATGLVHRDVKPANVLLALDGPRLIDFGIARAEDGSRLTATGVVVGSPGYLSPEQAQPGRGPVGPYSDVFSLGCVLAVAATGRRPFGSGPLPALLYRTVHDAADLDGVPEELRPLIEGCLAKEPSQRPPLDIVREALTRGEPADPWWPEPVTRLVTERAAALRGLGAVPAREAGRGEDPPGGGRSGARPGRGDRSPGARVTRRRLLAAGGATVGVAAAGGSFALWSALSGGSDTPPADGGGDEPPPRYTLALHADLSGERAATGRAEENGARLAVERLNARERPPFTMEFLARDDGGDPALAERVARELTADETVLAVIGTTTEDTCAVAAPVYSDALLALLSVSVGPAGATPVEHESYLATRPGDGDLMIAAVSYLTDPVDARRVHLLHDEAAGAWSRALIQGMREAYSGAPGVTVAVHTLAAGARDLGPPVAGLLADGPDAVVFGGRDPGRAALLARALGEAGFGGARLGFEPVIDAAFPEGAGEAAEGWVVAASFTDATAEPRARAFADAYRARFGEDPPYHAAEAYDTAHLVARALEELPGGEVRRLSLTRRLPLVSHQGVSKTFAFYPETAGARLEGALFLYQVEGGAFRYLGAADSVTGAAGVAGVTGAAGVAGVTGVTAPG